MEGGGGILTSDMAVMIELIASKQMVLSTDCGLKGFENDNCVPIKI